MRWLGSAAVTIAAVVTLARSSHADSVYVGVGIGAARLRGDLDRYFDTNGEVGGRFVGGLRFDDTALEVSFFGTDLHDADGGAHGAYSTFSLAIGLKQYVPLNDRISIYGRIGLDHTWLENIHGGLIESTLSGRGFDLGTGLQIDWRWHYGRNPNAAVGVAPWVDAGLQRVRLDHDGEDAISGKLAMIDLGASFQLAW
jgi:opacity protein-like surface antigen